LTVKTKKHRLRCCNTVSIKQSKITVTPDRVLSLQNTAEGHLWFLISNIFCNPLFLSVCRLRFPSILQNTTDPSSLTRTVSVLVFWCCRGRIVSHQAFSAEGLHLLPSMNLSNHLKIPIVSRSASWQKLGVYNLYIKRHTVVFFPGNPIQTLYL